MSNQNCSINMVEYYKNNNKEFFSDVPHDILIEKLIKLIPTYETNKIILGIDVGTNVGDYIPNLLKICNEPKSQILCFEPNLINIPEIEKKIISNDNITIYDYALSNENTTANFYNMKCKKENNVGNVLGSLGGNGKIIRKTEVKRLDDVLDERFSDNQEILIKLLKIDVEGRDSNVIKGSEKYLKNTEYIIFECSDCMDDCRGPGIKKPMKDIVDFLSKNDFDTYRIGTKKLFKVNDECWNDEYEKKFWSNCFSLKKDNKLINLLIDSDYNYIIN
jgi:FkbM family methyltransferase